MEGRVDAPALDKEVLLQLFCTFLTCCRVCVPITEVGEMGVINWFIDLDAEWNLTKTPVCHSSSAFWSYDYD